MMPDLWEEIVYPIVVWGLVVTGFLIWCVLWFLYHDRFWAFLDWLDTTTDHMLIRFMDWAAGSPSTIIGGDDDTTTTSD